MNNNMSSNSHLFFFQCFSVYLRHFDLILLFLLYVAGLFALETLSTLQTQAFLFDDVNFNMFEFVTFITPAIAC